MAIKITITMRDALEDFIVGRVLGDEPMAVLHQVCVYSHSAGGGCAIGKHLPLSIAATLSGLCNTEGVMLQMELAGFEAPRHAFWRQLQSAHDNLAGYGDRGSNALRDFQFAMKMIAGMEIG